MDELLANLKTMSSVIKRLLTELGNGEDLSADVSVRPGRWEVIYLCDREGNTLHRMERYNEDDRWTVTGPEGGVSDDA